jgi:alpha-glucosidase (family GH31 glycosyl hydrolase)
VRANLETLPLWVREGGLVPLGPALRWTGERRTDEIELRVAPFAGDGESRFVVPIDEERVPLRYVARAGTHRIEVGASRARFRIVALGAGAPAIEVVEPR